LYMQDSHLFLFPPLIGRPHLFPPTPEQPTPFVSTDHRLQAIA
jgi:hypothetical protein